MWPDQEYTMRGDETMMDVAYTVYGVQAMWQPIAVLNDVQDPRTLTAGQKIRLP